MKNVVAATVIGGCLLLSGYASPARAASVPIGTVYAGSISNQYVCGSTAFTIDYVAARLKRVSETEYDILQIYTSAANPAATNSQFILTKLFTNGKETQTNTSDFEGGPITTGSGTWTGQIFLDSSGNAHVDANNTLPLNGSTTCTGPYVGAFARLTDGL